MTPMDFPERTDLGNGYAWSAKLTSHDWARMFNFYFDVSLYKGDELVRVFSASTHDWNDGDPNCQYTPAEIRENVRYALHQAAKANIP